ncbi:LCP family protein [Exiguobacterium antarcticum]|uniref:LCP family glycopolymer transferase n=1 Tax=Exiguobacterium antarcticum TaxID=132920 RepID=UPI000285E9D4|nr:LCP family protein [Exiguobacterium antarcticum]AFS71497.1 Cell envelope-related transcriptional attenuator [Exiguobacterium antarcticum B7]
MRKWKWLILTLFGIGLLVFFGSGGYVYHQDSQTVEEGKVDVPVQASVETAASSQPDTDQPDKDKQSDKPTESKALSFLLLGVDQRGNEAGRSDTIIVVTVNPANGTSKMLSIPRDLKTEIIGNGSTDKINHAYAFGGPEMARETVEHLLDLRIDYFAEINLDGFTDLVDAVDGVTVENDINFSYYEMQFPKGELALNGKEALAYARMRYDDPRGDFGRQIRQRQVVQAVADKLTAGFSLVRFNDVLRVLGKNVKTDIPFPVVRKLATDYRTSLKNVETLSLEGSGGIEADDIYYWHPTDGSLKQVQTTLQTELQ